jgi:ABC-2 type transport system permease protein
MNWNSIIAILRKDVRDAVVTFRIVGILLMPLMMTGLYGFVIRDTLTTFRVVAYAPGGSRLVDVLSATPSFEVVAADDEASVETLIVEHAAHLGLILSADFDRALQAEENPPVTLLLNRGQLGADGVAQVVLTTIGLLSPQSLGVDLTQRPINEAAANGGLLASGRLDFRNTFAILSIVLVLATLGVFMVPVSIIEEKERRTIEALLVAPVSHIDLTVSKAIGGLFYAVVSGTVVLLVNQAFVDANVAALAVVLSLGGLAAVMLGLFMGSLFESMQSLNVWSTFAMIPFLGPIIMIFLPGNSALQSALQFLPTYHLLQGLRLTLDRQADLSGLGVHLAVLVVTALVFALGVLWLLRRREV